MDWKNISSWFHLFPQNDLSKGTEILKQLQELKQSLTALDLKDHDQRLSIKLIELPISTIKIGCLLAKRATAPKSFY